MTGVALPPAAGASGKQLCFSQSGEFSAFLMGLLRGEGLKKGQVNLGRRNHDYE
jgi:hypothetical protein